MDDVKVFVASVVDADYAQLALLSQTEGVSLNMQRRSVQIAGCDGHVIANIALSEAQVEMLVDREDVDKLDAGELMPPG